MQQRSALTVGPTVGLSYLIQGAKLLPKPGVKRYVFIPLLINIVLFSVAIFVANKHFESLLAPMVEWLPDWLDWLSTVLHFLFGAMILLIVFFTFSLVANIIAAPFNAYLAAKVELLVTGKSPPSVNRNMAQEVAIAARETVKRLLYMLIASIVVLIITLIMTVTTVLSPLVPVVWFVFGAWLLAIEYGEYPMTNHNLMFKEQRQRLKTRNILSLSFGSWVALGNMVPLLNLFVMPAAVAGATLAWIDHWQAAESSRKPFA